MKVKHLIVNLDGILFKTQQHYKEIWTEVLTRQQTPVDPHFFVRWIDVLHPEDMYARFQYFRPLKHEVEVHNLFDQYINHEISANRNLYQTEFLGIIKQFPELSLSVVSTSSKEFCEKLIDQLPKEIKLASMVTADDGIEGHPQPHLYLKTLKNLHAEPSECIVVESSRQGLQASYLANLKSIFLEGTFKKYDHEDLIKYSIQQCKDFSQLATVIDQYSQTSAQ